MRCSTSTDRVTDKHTDILYNRKHSYCCDPTTVYVPHLLCEEVVDLLGVLGHLLSSSHLLLSASDPGLHDPLHILKDNILMEETEQGLQRHISETDR